jgi:hypothetical protein
LTARASGESVEMRVVEVFIVCDGLFLDVDVYYKDPSALAALLTKWLFTLRAVLVVFARQEFFGVMERVGSRFDAEWILSTRLNHGQITAQ